RRLLSLRQAPTVYSVDFHKAAMVPILDSLRVRSASRHAAREQSQTQILPREQLELSVSSFAPDWSVHWRCSQKCHGLDLDAAAGNQGQDSQPQGEPRVVPRASAPMAVR